MHVSWCPRVIGMCTVTCGWQYWHEIMRHAGYIENGLHCYFSSLVQLYSQTLVERHDLDRARAAVMGAFVADAATMGLHW